MKSSLKDSGRFVPPYPPRQPKPVTTWRGFFGERARTSVYGWSQLAFQTDHLKRNILGFCGIRPVRASLIGLVDAPDPGNRNGWLQKMTRLGYKGA